MEKYDINLKLQIKNVDEILLLHYKNKINFTEECKYISNDVIKLISNDIIKNYHGIMSYDKEKENNDRGDNKLYKEYKKNFLSLDTINKLIDEYDIFDDNGQIDTDKLTNRLIVSFYFASCITRSGRGTASFDNHLAFTAVHPSSPSSS